MFDKKNRFNFLETKKNVVECLFTNVPWKVQQNINKCLNGWEKENFKTKKKLNKKNILCFFFVCVKF